MTPVAVLAKRRRSAVKKGLGGLVDDGPLIVKEKQVTHTNTRHNNTTHDHTKDHSPLLKVLCSY